MTVNAPIVGGFFRALAGGPLSGGAGSLLTLAGSVTATGAALLADDMEITGLLNAGSGGLTVLTVTAGRAMNLGGAAGGALSLTPAELANLVTSGPVTYAFAIAGGPVTVSSPITLGSSSVTINGTAFNVNPGASLTTAAPLTLGASAMAINGTVSAPQVTVNASSSVNLGAGAGGGLDLDQAELNNLATGVLRINGGAMMVQGPISRVGMGALALTGSTLTQATGATITADNLRLGSFGMVNLPEANNITNLAGSVTSLGLTNAATLNIGTVDGTNGLFASSATIMADDFNAVSPLTGSTHTITSRPAAPRTLNLGGADVAGQLNISAADLANIRGIIVNLSADTANIGGPVSASTSTSTLVIGPVTAARPLNIVSTKVGGALEFTPGELGNVTATFLTLGNGATGPVTVNTATTIPASVGTFTLRTPDPTGITLNTATPSRCPRTASLFSPTR